MTAPLCRFVIGCLGATTARFVVGWSFSPAALCVGSLGRLLIIQCSVGLLPTFVGDDLGVAYDYPMLSHCTRRVAIRLPTNREPRSFEARLFTPGDLNTLGGGRCSSTRRAPPARRPTTTATITRTATTAAAAPLLVAGSVDDEEYEPKDGKGRELAGLGGVVSSTARRGGAAGAARARDDDAKPLFFSLMIVGLDWASGRGGGTPECPKHALTKRNGAVKRGRSITRHTTRQNSEQHSSSP